jgi:hypothetical protein
VTPANSRRSLTTGGRSRRPQPPHRPRRPRTSLRIGVRRSGHGSRARHRRRAGGCTGHGRWRGPLLRAAKTSGKGPADRSSRAGCKVRPTDCSGGCRPGQACTVRSAARACQPVDGRSSLHSSRWPACSHLCQLRMFRFRSRRSPLVRAPPYPERCSGRRRPGITWPWCSCTAPAMVRWTPPQV